MSKVWRYCFLVAVASCLLAVRPALAAEAVSGHLVSVEWLEKNRSNPEVLILDASPAQLYRVQHIPGAVNADLMTYGARELAAAEMEKLLQRWGVSPGRKIIVYDQGGTFWATRIFYDLYASGFPASNLFVLDGGLAKWQAELAPVTKEPTPAPQPGTFRVASRRDEVRAKLPEVFAASGDTGGSALVDALDASWHFGEVVFLDRSGHIPNGRMSPSADFFNADKTFKSPEEIRRMLAYVGVKPEQQVYTYCGGGAAASVPFFAMKFLVGYPNVKLYEESLLGWQRDSRELPVWTYGVPSLMRESRWLQGWGGGMLRMFNMAQVSIVDVRPADAFKQAHVRFAVNVPAEVFKSNLDHPARLAEALGRAGVNASHEAVIVSHAGLTADAALAFLMLERLGQKKVSVFTDSLQTWAQRGFPVSREGGADAKNGPPQPPIAPTTYPLALRTDTVIADAKSTHGVYPKVFVASGKNLPAKAQDGQVVHVPYTELLTADGTPKAAKDIWKILAKAGVPWYAEIVCIADDPGEAAANYFVLKLMGFPDVKVLMT